MISKRELLIHFKSPPNSSPLLPSPGKHQQRLQMIPPRSFYKHTTHHSQLQTKSIRKIERWLILEVLKIINSITICMSYWKGNKTKNDRTCKDAPPTRCIDRGPNLEKSDWIWWTEKASGIFWSSSAGNAALTTELCNVHKSKHATRRNAINN